MNRTYQVTNHPVLTGIKREVLYTTLVDKPLEEYIKIFFTLKHYKLVSNVKTPITGLDDKELFLEASNTKWVDVDGNVTTPIDGDTTNLTKQYDYFINLFDNLTPPNLFSVIEYRIVKNFQDGVFD